MTGSVVSFATSAAGRRRQQFALRQVRLADDELARKHSALFHRDCARRDITVETTVFVNHDHTFGDDFSGHPPAYFQSLHAQPPEKLHFGFALHHNMGSGKPARNFSD